jgi:GYF domain 2
MPSQIRQWYLARDGQQYGPLDDAELAKLHELGHVLATDLLWRQGFPKWRSAFVLFPTRKHGVRPTAVEQSNSHVGRADDHAGYTAANQLATWRPALAKSLVALLCAMAIVAVYMHYPSLKEIIRLP